MVTGMRGLCNGLGPAMFGIVFYMFHVDLTDEGSNSTHSTPLFEPYSQVIFDLVVNIMEVILLQIWKSIRVERGYHIYYYKSF